MEKERSDELTDETMKRYALTHGVSHLVVAKRKEDAKKLILDVKWLMARASDGVRLMEDCKLLEEDRTVAVIGSAVGLSLSDLKKDPRRLVSQLCGRLMGAAGMMRRKEVKEEGDGRSGGGGGGRGESKEGERKEEAKEKEKGGEKKSLSTEYDYKFVHTWHQNKEDLPIRRNMITNIVHLLQKRKPNAPPEWLKKVRAHKDFF